MVTHHWNSEPACVWDNGSSTSKLGYAGMMEPEVEVASAIGIKRQNVSSSPRRTVLDQMSHLVETPDRLVEHANTHDFHYMIRNGLVSDWDALERLWHSCIYEKLRCDPENRAFLISESPFNSPENREHMAEIMFATFGTQGICLALQPVLSLISSWGSIDANPQQQLSGTVVDSGEGTTTVIPVADGHVLRHGIQQIPVGGRDITSYVQDQLRSNQRKVPPAKSHEVARRIKEEYCYVCSSLEKERGRQSKEILLRGQYSGIDSWSCMAGEELFLGGEVLFQPSLLKGPKSRAVGVPELVDSTIDNCPIDIKRVLYQNIVLSGGSTMFPDFGRRLSRDIKRRVDSRLRSNRAAVAIPLAETKGVDVNVINTTSQKHSAWLGGSIVASDERFQDWLITKKQYEEEGPRIARRSAGVLCTDLCS